MWELFCGVKFGNRLFLVNTSESEAETINFRSSRGDSLKIDSWGPRMAPGHPKKYALTGHARQLVPYFQKSYPQRKPLWFRFFLVLRFVCLKLQNLKGKEQHILRFGCKPLRLGMKRLTNRGGKPYVLVGAELLLFGRSYKLADSLRDFPFQSIACESPDRRRPWLDLQIGCMPFHAGSNWSQRP
jgi:hypothetical protein